MAQNHSIPTAPARRGRPRKAALVPTQFPGKVIRLNSRPRLVVGDLVEICGTALPGNIGKRAFVTSMDNEGWVRVESALYMLDTKDPKTGEVTRNDSSTALLAPENLYRLDNSRLLEVMRRIK